MSKKILCGTGFQPMKTRPGWPCHELAAPLQISLTRDVRYAYRQLCSSQAYSRPGMPVPASFSIRSRRSGESFVQEALRFSRTCSFHISSQYSPFCRGFPKVFVIFGVSMFRQNCTLFLFKPQEKATKPRLCVLYLLSEFISRIKLRGF